VIVLCFSVFLCALGGWGRGVGLAEVGGGGGGVGGSTNSVEDRGHRER